MSTVSVLFCDLQIHDKLSDFNIGSDQFLFRYDCVFSQVRFDMEKTFTLPELPSGN